MVKFIHSEFDSTLSKPQRCLPTRFSDGQTILEGFSGLPWEQPEGATALDRFSRKLYFPILDRILNDIKKDLLIKIVN